MMENSFTQHLKDQVKDLPLHNHDKDLWDKINSQLDFEDQIDLKVKDLPLHNHNPKLWDDIENRLEKTKTLKTKRVLYISSIAASIILLFGIYTLLTYSPGGKITVTTEYENSSPLFIEASTDVELQSKVDQMCLYNAPVCSSEEFIEIRTQILELNEAINEVNTVLERYGESENLVKRLIVMENEKSKLVSNLLEMLKS